MRDPAKKDQSFSIRMTPDERDELDSIAEAYDRPRSWVVRKFVRLFASLERTKQDGALNSAEAAALAMLKQRLTEPILADDEDEE